MTNMLRVIEVANGSKFGTMVNWPLKRRVHFAPSEYEVFRAAVAKLTEHNVKHYAIEKPAEEGTDLIVVVHNKTELNVFAEIYFPKIFKDGLELAASQDKKIRHSLGAKLRRIPRPTPNYVIATSNIEEVRRRLSQFGINA
jgi:hypothetical protein